MEKVWNVSPDTSDPRVDNVIVRLGKYRGDPRLPSTCIPSAARYKLGSDRCYLR